MQVNAPKHNSISPDGVMVGNTRISSNPELIAILHTMVPAMTAAINNSDGAMVQMVKAIATAEAALNVRKTVFQPPVDIPMLLARANSIWSAIIQIVSGRSVEDEIAIVGVNRAIDKVTAMCQKTFAERENKDTVNKNLHDLLETVVQCRLDLKQTTPASSGTTTITEEAEGYLKFLEETRGRMISRKSSGIAIPEKPTIENIAASVNISSTQESTLPMNTNSTVTAQVSQTTAAQPKLCTVDELLDFRKALRIAKAAIEAEGLGNLVSEITRISNAMSISFTGTIEEHFAVINRMIDEQVANATEALFDQVAALEASVKTNTKAIFKNDDGVKITHDPVVEVASATGLSFPSIQANAVLDEAEINAIQAAQASIGSAAAKPATVVEEVVVVVATTTTTPAPEPAATAEAKPDAGAQPAAASTEVPAPAKPEAKEPLLTDKQKRILAYGLSGVVAGSVVGAGVYMFFKRGATATAE